MKKALVTVINKPNKPKNQPESLRPISILPVFSKLIESIINQRLQHYIHKDVLFSPRQYGFEEGRRIEDLIHRSVDESNEQVDNGGHCAWIQLDIAGAFDVAWHPAILTNLHRLGCPRYMTQLLSNYLTDRDATVTIQGKRYTTRLERGCPQGSIL